jgi:hypothetical protein
MKVQREIIEGLRAQRPGHQKDLDVDQYYVWSTDDGSLYWVLDSTRNDEVVIGPVDLESAKEIADWLNADACLLEARRQVDAVGGQLDQPEPGRIYQVTGGPEDSCLLTKGNWAESEVRD